MLDLEGLFKKRPFIYRINDAYYAFGAGVCAKCDEGHVTLSLRYQKYADLKDNDRLTQNEAMEIYHKLESVAGMVRDKEEKEHVHLQEKFKKLRFSASDEQEIDRQLKDMVTFFQKYNLAN